MPASWRAARFRHPALLLARGCAARTASSSATAPSNGVAPAVSSALSMDDIAAYCKRRGFVFASSDMYGSIGTGYDYGPLGAVLKKNIVDAWWRDFILRRPDCVALDSAIMTNPRVWEASGHVAQFCDPQSECRTCHRRVRVDKLLKAAHPGSTARFDSLSLGELGQALVDLRVACPHCGAAMGTVGLGAPQPFNLLFKTHVGPMQTQQAQQSPQLTAAGAGVNTAAPTGAAAVNPNATSHAYLRPETAQGAYVNFLNVLNSTRRKLPLGVGQVGKSFRNEIAVGNFVFRTREFEQMELQYFCAPADGPAHYAFWVDYAEAWLLRHGVRSENVRRHVYDKRVRGEEGIYSAYCRFFSFFHCCAKRAPAFI